MIVKSDVKFNKKYATLRKGEKNRFKTRLKLFRENRHHPLLHDHELHGKYAGYRSINIGGDLRAIYKFVPPNTAVFVTIDTHTKLYD